MGHPILKGCVKEVRSYAKTIGVELTQAQTYEIVARARGFYNANVLAAEYVPSSHELTPVGQVKARKPKTQAKPDVEVTDLSLTLSALQEHERLDLGVTGLRGVYVAQRFEHARLLRKPVTMEVIIPLPNDQAITRQSISEVMFEHSDVVTDCVVKQVNYPYGKHHNAYLIQLKPYAFTLPNECMSTVRMSLAHTKEGLRDCLESETYKEGFRIGFGFSDVDWRIGRARDVALRDVVDETKFVRFMSDDLHKPMWLSKHDFDNLRHLVGCYYEVTTGLYEGMRIAFYV